MAPPTELVEKIQADAGRTEKGRQIALSPGAVEQVKDWLYTVKAQSGPGKYVVKLTPKGPVCDCPDFAKRNLPCKHAASVRFYLEKQTVAPTGEVTSEKIPITYSQAWTAYNTAQEEEVRLFDILLHDLLVDLEDETQVTGRPRNGLRNDLFCAVQKVYSQLSCRRARSLFGFAVGRGQLPKSPGYVVSSRALNREDVTPIISDLITKTALPLAALEEGFAPDSTGMQTTSFGAWREEKHGEKREHLWLKAHALAGTKTHVIARVMVTGKYGSDQMQFDTLIREAAQAGIPLKEVYADKAYSARINYALSEEIGFDLYVPFKSNATGRTTDAGHSGSKGHSTLWRKAFLFFQMHREEFEAKYHHRSNVESVFSALKRKFGENIRSKNPTAQVNELLAKILAYNITVVIHEMFEHGVIPDFLRDSACVKSAEAVSNVIPQGGF